MRAWLFLLGGLLIWFVHFGGIYAVASVADVVAEADAPLARLAIGALTLVCLAGDSLLAWMAFTGRGPGLADESDPGLRALWRKVGGGGALLSAAAVLWQGLPALIGH